MVERELGVDPHDFRRWVCLHEETHRVQFTSVPWLRDYVQGMMTEFLLASDLDPGAIVERLRAAAGAVAGAVRGGDGESLVEAMQTPAQRELLDKLTAVMTLVEGHGDYVMDAVGPQVVPSVADIREKFNSRRGSAGRMEQILRRILGIDLKMKQYAEGSRFVRTVVEEAGMTGFNKVWTSPETLPTRAEIPHPPTGSPGSADVGPAPCPSLSVRNAVRACVTDLAPGDLVLAACSGGADSLALAAALAFVAPRAGLRAGAVTVDHGLQEGSADRAASVAAVLAGLGLDPGARPSP